jgi:PIN domain nuclease of toxin-antitoxin system
LIVLDASALLAVLLNEPGSDVVLATIDRAVLSSVNVCEIVTRMITAGTPADAVLDNIGALRIPIIDFTAQQAKLAALLREPTRRFGVSLADRACLALAQQHGAIVQTADKVWSKLDLGIEIQLIR